MAPPRPSLPALPALVLSASLSAGCAAATPFPTPHVTPAPPPVESLPSAPPSPTSGQPAQTGVPGASAVEVAGAQSLVLQGVFTPAVDPSGGAVLLLHMYGGSKSDWESLADELARAGLASLAIDLRGHGQTGGAEDWSLAVEDVAAAFEWLRARPGVDPGRVAVVGASIGANLSMVQSATRPEDVAAAALLSPGFDYFRVRIEGLTAPGVPLFLAAAEGDGYSADTVRALAAQAGDAATLIVFDGAAHGTDMFAAHPGLAGRLVGFLVDSLSR